MRVLLDATMIPSDLGGVGRYIDDLAPELVNVGVDLVMVVQERDGEHFRRALPDSEILTTGRSLENRLARMAWEQVGLPRLVRSKRPDVLHSPHYTSPEYPDAPSVITLHDATFFSSPEAHSRVKRVFFTRAIARAVQRADALVVPSLATRDETIRYVGGDPGLFHVAYHGVDRTVFHPVDEADRRRVASALGLESREYIGFLGTLEPRKNVPNLVRGWVEACASLPDPPALVLAGGSGWDRDIDAAVASVPSGLEVVRPGYLPLKDLPGFLSGSLVLAYPSIGEGFGLPVLEAMSCGAAVLTTRLLALPEVGGDAVSYCEPDSHSIARGLLGLLGDPAKRHELGAAAIRRSMRFTWRSSAISHVEAYEDAMEGHR